MSDSVSSDRLDVDPQAGMLTRVRGRAIEEMGGGNFPELDVCIERAVTSVGAGSVSSFVPLLTLQEVRCCIRASTCDCGA